MIPVKEIEELKPYLWEASRLSEAIEQLSKKSGFLHRNAEVPQTPTEINQIGSSGLNDWLHFAGSKAGIEIFPIETSYSKLDKMLSNFSPGILQIKVDENETGLFLLCVGSNKKNLSLINTSLKVNKVPIETIHKLLCEPWESKFNRPINTLLDEVGVSNLRKSRVKQNIFNEQLGNLVLSGIWMLRMNPGVHPYKRLFIEKVPHKLAGMIFANIAVSLLGIASWSVIGLGAFKGNFEWVWLFAWALFLFTMIPFRLMSNWFSSLLSIQVGALFKERLLFGILNLSPENTKKSGVGQFMGRVMESEAVKQMAMGGGLLVFYSLTQLFLALGILLVAGAGVLIGMFFLWGLVSLCIGWRYYLLRRDYTHQYRSMTNDLVERMVGHRTRLAQEKKSEWHESEDQILTRYLDLSEKVDFAGTLFQSLVPRGWLLIGLGGFTYSYLLHPSNQITLGLMLGGIMVTSKAYSSLVEGMFRFIELIIAWKQFEPIFNAGKESQESRIGGTFNASEYLDSKPKLEESKKPVLMVRDLTFKYHNFGKAVIESGSMDIHEGDRVLIKGPSGGGKSTLATLLTCIRNPLSGLVLLKGLDRETMGAEEWQKRVVLVPQFHENYILTESFAFNLLMGKKWPPSPEDYKEATQICEELGLSDLLQRMPSGFQQMIGESGWRLSHGEKSRVYIARALLQKCDLLLLDESFASLDAYSLKISMDCVLKRVKSLIVIAHP